MHARKAEKVPEWVSSSRLLEAQTPRLQQRAYIVGTNRSSSLEAQKEYWRVIKQTHFARTPLPVSFSLMVFSCKGHWSFTPRRLSNDFLRDTLGLSGRFHNGSCSVRTLTEILMEALLESRVELELSFASTLDQQILRFCIQITLRAVHSWWRHKIGELTPRACGEGLWDPLHRRRHRWRISMKLGISCRHG